MKICPCIEVCRKNVNYFDFTRYCVKDYTKCTEFHKLQDEYANKLKLPKEWLGSTAEKRLRMKMIETILTEPVQRTPISKTEAIQNAKKLYEILKEIQKEMGLTEKGEE